MIFSIYLVFAILFFICVIYKEILVTWCRIIWFSRQFQSYPGAIFPIGHALLVLNMDKLPSILHAVTNYGWKLNTTVKLWIGPVPFYVVTDIDVMSQIINKQFEKPYIYKFSQNLFGQGLVTADEKVWKPRRKILNPSFNNNIMYGFLSNINDESRNFADKLSPMAGKGYFKHEPYVYDAALQSLLRSIYGLTEINDHHLLQDLRKAVEEIFDIYLYRLNRVWLHPDIIYNLTATKKKETASNKKLYKISDQVLNTAKIVMQNFCNQDNVYRSFIQILLEQERAGMLTMNEVREESVTMVIAGHETNALTMIFLLTILGQHPEIQDKLYKEILSVFGDSDRDVTKDDLNKCVYIDAVVKEILRLYPAVPIIMRYIDEDITIDNKTFCAGSNIVVPIVSLNRGPLWGPKPEQFMPDRWINKTTNEKATLLTFSTGRRGCLGKSFALITVKTMLIHVLRRYRIKAPPGDVKVRFSVLLKPEDDLEIFIENRSQ